MSHCKSGEVRIHIIGVLNTQYVNVISNNKTNDISSMESWELLSPTTADENLLDVPEATLSKSQISLSLSLSLWWPWELTALQLNKHMQNEKTQAN